MRGRLQQPPNDMKYHDKSSNRKLNRNWLQTSPWYNYWLNLTPLSFLIGIPRKLSSSDFWAFSFSSALASDCWLSSLPGCLNTQRSPNEQSGSLLHTDWIDPGGLSAKLFSLLLLSSLLDCGLLWEYRQAVPNLQSPNWSNKLHFNCSQSLQQGPLLGSVCHPFSIWWFWDETLKLKSLPQLTHCITLSRRSHAWRLKRVSCWTGWLARSYPQTRAVEANTKGLTRPQPYKL